MHDVILSDDHLALVAILPPCGERRLEILLGLLLGVAKGGGFLEILGLDGGLLLSADAVDPGLEILGGGRAGHRADAGAGSGLVHDVDRLVGQEAPGEVAVGEFCGRFQGGVIDDGLVVRLVLVTEPLEDQDGVLHGGSLDLHRLEAALEGRVLLDVLAVFVERGGPDALEFTAAERGLDDVGGVHGPLGGTRADDRVEFVDEEDDILVPADFVHHRLDPLLELAAVFGAGNHEGEVEGDDPLLREDLRDIAGDDLLRETLRNGRLADTRLADEDGIVLAAAAENLDDAFDLLGASDDGVKLVLAGQFGEIPAECLERRRLGLLA